MTEPTRALTPRMQRTLARAHEIASDRGHAYLGTEHVLLALLDDPRGIARGVIDRLGYRAQIRDEVIRIIERDGYAGRTNDTVVDPT